MTFLESSRQHYVMLSDLLSHLLPHGSCDVIRTVNVIISTLRGAMRMVDPLLERESDTESNYEGLKLLKSSFKYYLLKLIIVGPLQRYSDLTRRFPTL